MLPFLACALVSGPWQDLPVTVDGWLCHPHRLMVKASRPVSAAVAALGGRVTATFPQIGWSTVEVPNGDLRTAKHRIEALPGVRAVEYDRAARLAYSPNDPLWPNEWHMRQIKVDLAWDTSKGDSQTIVAVIDTGCLVTHPDLQGNIWINVGEIPGNGIDDDNNGYVDDVNGFDFVSLDGTLEDYHGHGTGCSGLVGAVQDNNIGISGACPKVRMMELKACNDNGYLFDSYLVPAYLYGADNGARVFSMSYFSDRVSQAEKDAMDYAVAKGVLPVAAAGNSYSVIPYYPGAYENVLSVAATDESNNRCWFSNFGSWVDVAAPGQDLVTTANNGDYMGFGGTSGACPHVAGVAALLIGAKPSATATEIRNAIEDTATLLNQPPYGEFANYGLVNADEALKAVLGVPAPPKPAVVRYAATLGQGPGVSAIDPSNSIVARIYGRGFQGLQDLQVKRNGVLSQIVARSRDWVDVRVFFRQAGDLTVWNGGTLIATIPNPVVRRSCHPLTEASSPTAWVDGGFYQTVVDDGQSLLGHRDGNGEIYVDGTFRKVTANTITDLRIKRSYAVGGGTEYVQLYDWSSASYPYGNWVTVASGSASAAAKVTTVAIPDLARYIDPEGTVYVRVACTPSPSGEEMRIDSLRLQDSR